MCATDGMLRARLDGELTPADSLAIDEHLAGCAGCRQRAEELAGRAERIQGLLANLAEAAEAAPDARAALARLRARRSAAAAPSWLARLFPLRLAPAWGALAAVALVVMLISSAETRAFAQKLLGLLRVRNIVVVSIDRSAMTEGKGKLWGQMLSENIVVTKDGKPETATSREKAGELAGFAVRLLEARRDAPRLIVEGERAFYLTVDRARIQALLNIVGRPDLEFPESIDGAKVAVDIPRGVVAAYGDCPKRSSDEVPPETWYNCVAVAQFPTPTVITLPELDIAPIAEVGLQLAGMTPEEARAFSRTVDWTSTLVLPLPRDVASYENVEVDGVKGVLIQHKPFRNRPASYALLWAKTGMIYSLSGFGNPAYAVPLAESLR